jgi:hypothetical protein
MNTFVGDEFTVGQVECDQVLWVFEDFDDGVIGDWVTARESESFESGTVDKPE